MRDTSPPQPSGARTTRLNLNLSDQSRADLNRISEKAGCTVSDLVRFGLMLVKLYYDAKPGEKLVLAKSDGSLMMIMPPWGPPES